MKSGKIMMETSPWYRKGRSDEEAVTEWEPPSSNRDVLESSTVDADLGAILYASKLISGKILSNDAPDQAKFVHLKVLRDLVQKDERSQVFRENEEITELNYEKRRKAITVVHRGSLQLSCWIWREEGYSTFTCPILQPTKRLYFSYR